MHILTPPLLVFLFAVYPKVYWNASRRETTKSRSIFQKLRKPLDDRFLLFRAVAAAEAGDGRQDLVNICAGRFERTVAERIGNKALRLRRLQLFFCDDLLQLLLFLLLHITLPVAVNIRCGVDRTK